MRKNIVAGNWKMNTTVPEGIELAKAVVARSAEVPAEEDCISCSNRFIFNKTYQHILLV